MYVCMETIIIDISCIMNIYVIYKELDRHLINLIEMKNKKIHIFQTANSSYMLFV